MRYAVAIEKAGANYSAYVPDLPGCVATGETREEAEREIREAVRFHLEGLREDGVAGTRTAGDSGLCRSLTKLSRVRHG
jgi:predicted RNase H-like HicB family nuclease